jgi:hypothetical protein
MRKRRKIKGLRRKYKWSPKAMKFKGANGYVVKVKARLNHECHICGETIYSNEEYYRLQYYGSWRKYPICESCWNGKEMDSKNKAKYQETEVFAADGRGYGRW